jgi:SAM-dependent methyltransferase
MTSFKSAVKNLLPQTIILAYQMQRLRWDMIASRTKSREEIFSDIYNKNRWGGERGTYCSGTGSQANIAFPYVSTIRSLISKEVVKEIVDLGCGDFEVARRILSPDLSYLGCDIVPGLVARNTARFGTDKVRFCKLDVVSDPLPQFGDLCIIRQVLQHLSNREIVTVLRKTRRYPLVVITDEQIVGDCSDENVDMPAYHGTRRVFGQGLKVERKPFLQHVEILLEHSSGYSSSSETFLRTVLIRNDRQQ